MTPAGSATLELFGGEALHGAVLSDDRLHRYRLWRTVAPLADALRVLAFVMLNPSTADALANDPTVHKCVAIARVAGYGRVEVVNLYSYRATDPGTLKRAITVWGTSRPDAVTGGAANRDAIASVAAAADAIVCAWGAQPRFVLEARVPEVLALLPEAKRVCLGRTHAGHPKHPLFVPASTPLVPFLPEVRP